MVQSLPIPQTWMPSAEEHHSPRVLNIGGRESSAIMAPALHPQACTQGERPVSEPVSEPKIAQKSPYPVAVEAGKSYFWCSCGLSANQPFCDGSHKTTDMTPVRYEAAESAIVYFCGCKHTGKPVLCDGSHARL